MVYLLSIGIPVLYLILGILTGRSIYASYLDEKKEEEGYVIALAAVIFWPIMMLFLSLETLLTSHPKQGPNARVEMLRLREIEIRRMEQELGIRPPEKASFERNVLNGLTRGGLDLNRWRNR